jgi:hypothetical protein
MFTVAYEMLGSAAAAPLSPGPVSRPADLFILLYYLL